MRDNAARALRAEDDIPRLADLRAVTPDMPLPYEFPRDRRFSRDSAAAATDSAETGSAVVTLPPPEEVVLRDRALEPEPQARPAPEPAPRNAPGRAYGTHRRGEAAAGYQPGRRTVEITGQVQPPRRRSQTQAAFVANPDRPVLWAFLLALFLVVMAIVTAGAGA